ncbi:MAG TPA: D-glycero-D-manno-heptose 1-phosphate guanosyltransferase [Bacteroidaceae bacterium]|nr:D-glycero-D-manno-heptose 1-phosphate guanosyltransferase [Bacteroidaceae bacterium]
MNPDEAIILAGGLGTRLRPVLPDLPKAMAPIGDKPFLEYLLLYLSGSGIRQVVISVGYKYEAIQSWFGNSFLNTKLIYAIEDEPLGTGGAIRYAMHYIQGESVLLLNGDTFFNVNLVKFTKFFHDHDSDIAMTVKLLSDVTRYGTVIMDRHRVRGFIARQAAEKGYINGGIYLLKSTLFDRYTLPGKFSFEKDFLEKHINDLNIAAMKSPDYFIDIGVPGDYEKARTELPGLLL